MKDKRFSNVLIFFGIAIVGSLMGVWLANRLSSSFRADSVVKLSITNKVAPTPIPPSPTPAPNCATLVFGGDMMFDRNIREKAQKRGSYDFILTGVEELFFQADGIIANLEGPVTDYPSRSVGSVPGSTDNYFFTFSPEIITTMMARWPFYFNLGNNHILNFGQDGLDQTYQNIDRSALGYFGYVQPDQSKPSYLIQKFNGITVGLVNYNQFVEGGRERVLADIDQIRSQVDVLVVYTHWGNEYVQENEAIRQLAYELVDAGADLIIGSHPHVVQGQEDYQGVRIYYSLGNMVFDQYFEEAVQNGLLVTANVCQQVPESELGDSTDINTPLLQWQFTDHPIRMLKTGETVIQ